MVEKKDQFLVIVVEINTKRNKLIFSDFY